MHGRKNGLNNDNNNAEPIELIIEKNNEDIIDENFLDYMSRLKYYIKLDEIDNVKYTLATQIANNYKQDKNIKDIEYLKLINSALMGAVKLNRLDIARYLLASGADVNYINKKGNSLLIRASILGYNDIVKLLLEYNADVNTQFDNGKTALFIATENEHIDVVKTLLAVENIDVNFKFKANAQIHRTTHYIGYHSENQEISNLYKQYDAQFSIRTIESEIKRQIKHFRKEGENCFSFNNNIKANRIERALRNAQKSITPHHSLEDFLNYKKPGHESIKEALSYHRVGFFGETTSWKEVNKKAKRIEGSLENSGNHPVTKKNTDNLDPHWKRKWKKIYCNMVRGSELEAAFALLSDYAGIMITGGIFAGTGGTLGRFFTGKWDRQHGDAVQGVIRYFSFPSSAADLYKTIEYVLASIKDNIEKSDAGALNPNDDLAKIIKIIESYVGVKYDELNTKNIDQYSVDNMRASVLVM